MTEKFAFGDTKFYRHYTPKDTHGSGGFVTYMVDLKVVTSAEYESKVKEKLKEIGVWVSIKNTVMSDHYFGR